jgi:hypothetical protein
MSPFEFHFIYEPNRILNQVTDEINFYYGV